MLFPSSLSQISDDNVKRRDGHVSLSSRSPFAESPLSPFRVIPDYIEVDICLLDDVRSLQLNFRWDSETIETNIT